MFHATCFMKNMAIKVAINGFGRIGRNTFRAALQKRLKSLNFVAINDLTSPENLAYLLQYDTAYGNSNLKIDYKKDQLIVNGKKIKVFAEKDPSNLPWKKLGIDVVLECTGLFTNKEGAGLLLLERDVNILSKVSKSEYKSKFYQGATLVPRTLVFFQEERRDDNFLVISSDPDVITRAKTNWKHYFH